MAGNFQVETDRLESLSRELRDGVGSMGAAMHSMETTGPKTTGSKELDHACDDFQEKWEYGLKQLRKSTESVAKALEATARAYRQTDEELARAFGGSDGGGAGAGASAGIGAAAAAAGRGLAQGHGDTARTRGF